MVRVFQLGAVSLWIVRPETLWLSLVFRLKPAYVVTMISVIEQLAKRVVPVPVFFSKMACGTVSESPERSSVVRPLIRVSLPQIRPFFHIAGITAYNPYPVLIKPVRITHNRPPDYLHLFAGEPAPFPIIEYSRGRPGQGSDHAQDKKDDQEFEKGETVLVDCGILFHLISLVGLIGLVG